MRSSADIEMAMRVYSDTVWRACLVYLSPAEAEDVFQDAFMKYALHDGEFRSEEHKKAWLIRVAINACKDVLKAKRTKNESLENIFMLLKELIPGLEYQIDGEDIYLR